MTHTRGAWAERLYQLSQSMPGFDGLILAVQGLLVGVSLATGEIWQTPNVATTHQIAWGQLQSILEMTEAWGLDQ